MKNTVAIRLLCIAAFLVPLLGGQIPLDRLSLGDGPGALFFSIAGGSETPLFQHAILALLIAAAIAWTVVKRQVLQTPTAWVAGSLLFFGGLLLASVGYASHKGLALIAATEWLTYGMAFFAVVACIGRRGGVLSLLYSLMGGCSVIAVMGVVEVAQSPAGWRIFAGWQNPNAVAGMLVIGLILGFGLSIVSEGLERILVLVGTALITIALYHTQSKGGYLVAFLGLGTAALLLLVLRARSSKQAEGEAPAIFKKTFTALALVVVVFVGVYFAFHQTSRLASGTESQEQSVGYRVLLWSGAKKLIAARPTGYGIGNYAPISPSTGVHPWTALTHSSIFQLLVEVGVQGLAAIVVFFLAWLWYVLRGATRLPVQSQVLAATIVGCFVATAANNFFESNLYFFGIGLALFMLLGAGLMIANDAVAPEYMPKGFRATLGAAATLLLALLVYFGLGEYIHARARFQGEQQDLAGARALSESGVAIAPYSAESWYLLGRNNDNLTESLKALREADSRGTSPKIKSAIATRLMQQGDVKGAIEELKSSFQLDPNELETYTKILQLQEANGDHAGAVKTARDLIKVEQTPYLQVRALPELIATQTYEARIFLANQETDPKKLIELLKPAIEGYAKYARITMPNVIRFSKADPPMPYGSESVPEATRKLEDALKAGQRLQQIYRSDGDESGAASVEPLLGDIRKALEGGAK